MKQTSRPLHKRLQNQKRLLLNIRIRYSRLKSVPRRVTQTINDDKNSFWKRMEQFRIILVKDGTNLFPQFLPIHLILSPNSVCKRRFRGRAIHFQ